MNININQVQLLGNRILIERDKKEAFTAPSGLTIVAESAQTEPPATGRVRAAGPDCVTVKIGDRVMFSPYAGREMDFVLTRVLLMSEPEIAMVIADL